MSEATAAHNACAEYFETLADFFEHGATGPGERTYTVSEVAQMVRDWAKNLRIHGPATEDGQ